MSLTLQFLDAEGRLVAFVISKKAAAGATPLVLDVPVGPTVKARDAASVGSLSARPSRTAEAIGIESGIVSSGGSAPVVRGIGPAPEAREVLAVVVNEPRAPDDLRAGAVELAGAPHAKSAGVLLGIRTGSEVQAGEPMLTVHAESRGELDYALAYAEANPDIVQVIER